MRLGFHSRHVEEIIQCVEPRGAGEVSKFSRHPRNIFCDARRVCAPRVFLTRQRPSGRRSCLDRSGSRLCRFRRAQINSHENRRAELHVIVVEQRPFAVNARPQEARKTAALVYAISKFRSAAKPAPKARCFGPACERKGKWIYCAPESATRFAPARKKRSGSTGSPSTRTS